MGFLSFSAIDVRFLQRVLLLIEKNATVTSIYTTNQFIVYESERWFYIMKNRKFFAVMMIMTLMLASTMTVYAQTGNVTRKAS